MVKLYMVLPEIPSDQKVIWDPAWSSGLNWGVGQGQQNCVIGGYTTPTQKPWAFRKDKDTAHELAQDYAKTYSQPYYIAEVDVQGRYAPPPPAYEPVFEESSNWVVPK